ncbi:hypothetical protein WR25_16483 [Diploscapter pachys]|uniref:Uncharacterized protein n=1 Tax=Diploscapter pachys TaxID=2018661 RepID=A0A2A2J9C7_9BILA|nr:hypothetical protein WR25_16483 [Diploscapter pachys]
MNHNNVFSIDSSELNSLEKCRLSSREQRQLIDEQLDLLPSAGVSCGEFLTDREVCEAVSSHNSSPRGSVDGETQDLVNSDAATGSTGTEVKKEEADEAAPTTSTDESVRNAVEKFTNRLLSLLADQRWQTRHGAAVAIAKVFCNCYSLLPSTLIDNSALRLLQVLVLDQFNDFVSGRNATAPVRETCAQALGHLLHLTDEHRKEHILETLVKMLEIKGDKLWHCRQSALLVMKYYFAVATASDSFDRCFKLVVSSLSDLVDDVVCCAVNTLSSFIANQSTDQKRANLVERIMHNIWQLLEVESKKDQLRSGLDALAIDLLQIVDTWIKVEPTATLSREQTMTVAEMMDASFVSRTHKIVILLDLTLQRSSRQLTATDVFTLLKSFYRVILFAPPTDSLALLEQIYITSRRILDLYKESIITGNQVSQVIGKWIGCLLFDHVSPVIDVFVYEVDGQNSNRNEPSERLGSEEMRFLNDRQQSQKDNVYMTRKILASKLLALLLDALYQSQVTIGQQPLSLAIQLLFGPYLKSTSLFPVMGAAILVNEWAALYQAAVSSGKSVNPPLTLIQLCDSHLRSPAVSYDELTSSINLLTNECNEFIDYCTIRGCDRSRLTSSNENVDIETLSKLAYESCKGLLSKDKDVEALDARFKLLTDSVQFTKMAVRTNVIRISAFLSSALFYFGYIPEKMTPLIRPIVDCLFVEENEIIASEIFRGSVPRLVLFGCQRNPKPYVKVIARAFEGFSQCPVRIPTLTEWSDKPTSIISLEQLNAEREAVTTTVDKKISPASKNAELFFIILSNFSVEQLPEFYALFDLDDELCDEVLIARLELHGCLWSRVGSRLSDVSTTKLFTLMNNDNPAKRLAAAKAVSTFARSQLTDTTSRMYGQLAAMARDLHNDTSRRAVAEVLYRLSLLDSALSGVISLFAPMAFSLLVDKIEEIRNMASEAFRHFMPLLMLESPLPPAGLTADLLRERERNIDFIHVLSSPSKLPIVAREAISGLTTDIEPRHYQLEGITWMRFLRRYNLNGVLADDMGLGKTLMTLCSIVMSIEEDKESARCSLIVCPRTLVDHWCNEYKRFFPHRLPAKQSLASYKIAEIIVIGYDDLKSNPSFEKKTWNYVVLDEGHVMRNAKTQIWRSANKLRAQSRLILSGTPVQNSPSDVWALFEWLMPGYLGTEKQFRGNFLRKIIRCRGVRATERDMQEGDEAVKVLHKLILPFVLRRLKNEVLKELPEKNLQDVECQLTDRQRQIYRFIVDRCSSDEAIPSMPHISPLHALITLRKLLDHAKLVADVLHKLEAPIEMIRDLETESSGKLEVLGQLLSECGICQAKDDSGTEKAAIGIPDEEVLEDMESASQPSHRALIFCQWKASVQLVSDALKSQFSRPIPHLILDGNVPPASRQSVVDQFNSNSSIDVLVLTTHIGGVGLNLTGADVVIFLDHDWNPMKDLQAIDRAHRLGQTRNVNVYRLVTKGTIEEKVMSLCKFKVNTAEALIGAENASLRSMGTSELMEMFTLEGDDKPAAREPSRKKTKKSSGNSSLTEEEKWNLVELWDESQYAEQFDVANFMRMAHS